MYMCRPHSAHFPQQLTVLLAQLRRTPCWREHSSSQVGDGAATTIRRMPPPLEPESSSVGSTDDESAPMKRPAAEDEPELPPAAAWKALVCLFLAMVATRLASVSAQSTNCWLSEALLVERSATVMLLG